MATKGKKRVRRGRDASQEQILKGSLELMGKVGWTGLTFQAIARHCKMGPSNIVYHFENRETLLMALLNRISQNNWRFVAESMKPEMDACERLLVHFQRNLEFAREYPEEAQVILQIYAEAPHNKEFASVFRVMIERAQLRVKEHLLAGQREGLFRFSSSPDTLAKYLHSLLVGAFIGTMGGRLGEPLVYSDEEWMSLFKSMLGYLKSSG